MTQQPFVSESWRDCGPLVAQCVARIGVTFGDSKPDRPESVRLARRVAAIVRENQGRGRIPADSGADDQANVPDHYVDRVLRTFGREVATIDALRVGDETAWGELLDLMQRHAFNYLVRSGVRGGQANHLAPDVTQSCALTLWGGAQ